MGCKPSPQFCTGGRELGDLSLCQLGISFEMQIARSLTLGNHIAHRICVWSAKPVRAENTHSRQAATGTHSMSFQNSHNSSQTSWAKGLEKSCISQSYQYTWTKTSTASFNTWRSSTMPATQTVLCSTVASCEGTSYLPRRVWPPTSLLFTSGAPCCLNIPGVHFQNHSLCTSMSRGILPYMHWSRMIPVLMSPVKISLQCVSSLKTVPCYSFPSYGEQKMALFSDASLAYRVSHTHNIFTHRA
jgi:hypothetical protein